MLKSSLNLLFRNNYCITNSIFHRALPAIDLFGKQSITTTAKCHDLMEFFEDERNWGKDEIRSGRSWRADELRLKSNEDLHKLWYVLLKEKNMLLTMEHYYKENYDLFPSPERIDKVEDSMKNLETVVRERNKAYYLLETGEDGERPGVVVHNAIGLPFYHKQTQHLVPKYRNKWWKENFVHSYDYTECNNFLRHLREKENIKEKQFSRRRKKTVIGLLKRFKNIDKEYLKELYPDVNVTQLADEVAGHWQR